MSVHLCRAALGKLHAVFFLSVDQAFRELLKLALVLQALAVLFVRAILET